MDIEKKLDGLVKRVQYARDILGDAEDRRLTAFANKLDAFLETSINKTQEELWDKLNTYDESLAVLEKDIDKTLSAMDKVRIVRHSERICLEDILENVYDNYTVVGGKDDMSIDPGMVIARAYITRRVGKKVHNQPVMVVGQEKGHGQEFRNGGCIKPWGNANALRYMKVAARENIPIHTYVFTPGSYPVEDYPGAAQQIAENIYEMCGLDVPIISVISEGGSGGAEAIAMADKRLMLSHGYYSVISPEGAAAIEGRIRGGERAPSELIETCAKSQCITADDNLRFGYIDGIIREPALGARPEHFDFYKMVRSEVVRATDEVVLSVKGLRLFSKAAIKNRNKKDITDESVFVRWQISPNAKDRLLWKRYKKYRRMAQDAFDDKRSFLEKLNSAKVDAMAAAYSTVRYDMIRKYQSKIQALADEAKDEMHVVTNKFDKLKHMLLGKMGANTKSVSEVEAALTKLSVDAEPDIPPSDYRHYISPRASEDKEITCPNAEKNGCLEIWSRDLFDEFAGVCPTCGHHFPMEYRWYMANLFDWGTVREFNKSICSANPTGFPNFQERLDGAKAKTGLQSGCITYEGAIKHTKVTCATLVAPFRGGSVGAAEGEKFIRALELAGKKRYPFLAYVHGTAGIRIQEGTNGLIQMPRVTMAVRRYIESGGLYIVLYDTNSYAGPVASFLGCSPYQYAVRSSRIGFAGPGVIKETTGMDIPPDYHSAYNALSRGHIQDIWDRRDIRRNLHQAFLTVGGRNLYYR
ncbi:carboxyl transferase domain-containing protein [Maridesulfovibrio salexigens]|uniref:Acetyl-coenzyme A carboxylase carboxyl transferase subunits beta/alpha n=1 Tax=Maridesulfovibrio salexigens (strain ATCC 14822 / DSM 2638 / NCIMB 8403 / VKM B-1763) TaxID=526222 RepID=C6BX78_MARSD|nr:carboxyl transferase domain-containing protein [Maridesulfovibrio salexigens]ACS80384.1 Acetyl-CoA carboxylase [Maridesulfovibrio salexigens DSM 2638]